MKFEPPKQWLDEIAAGTPFGDRAKKAIEAIAKSRGATVSWSPKPEVELVSEIGTRLAQKFKDRIGALPCSACQAAIRNLNSMTAEQVRENEDQIVAEIMTRAQKSMKHWWGKLLVYADQTFHVGASEYVIRRWLRESCDEEKDAND